MASCLCSIHSATVEAIAIDYRLVIGKPEDPRARIAGLRVRGNGTKLDMPETQLQRTVRTGRILVEAGRKPKWIGKTQTRQRDRQRRQRRRWRDAKRQRADSGTMGRLWWQQARQTRRQSDRRVPGGCQLPSSASCISASDCDPP